MNDKLTFPNEPDSESIEDKLVTTDSKDEGRLNEPHSEPGNKLEGLSRRQPDLLDTDIAQTHNAPPNSTNPSTNNLALAVVPKVDDGEVKRDDQEGQSANSQSHVSNDQKDEEVKHHNQLEPANILVPKNQSSNGQNEAEVPNDSARKPQEDSKNYDLGVKRMSCKQWRANSSAIYDFSTIIGKGTFGKVFKAKLKSDEPDENKEFVALKKLNMSREEEGFPITALREIQILKRLKHENVV
jgi:hypothetical protein